MPEVSVVIAAHNQAAWLGEAIASVRAQTLADWELIVVDDGSTDTTAAVVAAHTDDRRIRYLAQPQRERSVARNRGVAETSAPLVAFLDGDDVWRPEKLARQVAELDRHPDAALCYTTARFMDERGRPLAVRKPPRVLSGHIFGDLLRANVLILSSVVLRRAAFEAAGGFAVLPTYGCEDWDLWLRLARAHAVAAVDAELTLYRRHDANTAWRQVLESAFVVIDRCYADPVLAREAPMSRAALRARHYWLNAAARAEDERATAVPLVMQALREAPTAALSRPALAALAGMVLPQPALRALRQLLA